jgi:hypothetical protein
MKLIFTFPPPRLRRTIIPLKNPKKLSEQTGPPYFSIFSVCCARLADNYLVSVQNINWSSREAAMANKGQFAKKV